jgi:hypothetical protein
VNGVWRVPKAVLVRGLVAAVESGRLKVANGLSGGDVRELLDFKREITKRGNAVFGGEREHDDLVNAVALACWWSGSRETGVMPIRESWREVSHG